MPTLDNRSRHIVEPATSVQTVRSKRIVESATSVQTVRSGVG